MNYNQLQEICYTVDAQNDFSTTGIDTDVLLMEQELQDDVIASIERLSMLSKVHRGPSIR